MRRAGLGYWLGLRCATVQKPVDKAESSLVYRMSEDCSCAPSWVHRSIALPEAAPHSVDLASSETPRELSSSRLQMLNCMPIALRPGADVSERTAIRAAQGKCTDHSVCLEMLEIAATRQQTQNEQLSGQGRANALVIVDAQRCTL